MILRQIEEYVLERLAMVSSNNPVSANAQVPLAPDTNSVCENQIPHESSQSNSAKRKRGDGGWDLDERKEIKKKETTREMILALLDFESKIPKDRVLTEGARSFIKNELKPVLTCFNKHYASDLEAFAVARPKLTLSTFKKRICTGGTVCGLK